MDIKAILFDKDGTLIDFDAFWIPVSAAAVKDILSRAGAGDDMLTEVLGALGVHGDTTDPDGLLCRGTYGEMGLKIRGVLSEHGIRLSEEEAMRMTGDAFSRSAGAGTVKPVCAGLRGVLERLKEQHAEQTEDDGQAAEETPTEETTPELSLTPAPASTPES